MSFTDSQMDKFEAHFRKKTNCKCPMCGTKKFDFGMDALGMLRVDARAAVKIVEPDRGRVFLFVNCLECGYYCLTTAYSGVQSIQYCDVLFWWQDGIFEWFNPTFFRWIINAKTSVHKLPYAP